MAPTSPAHPSETAAGRSLRCGQFPNIRYTKALWEIPSRSQKSCCVTCPRTDSYRSSTSCHHSMLPRSNIGSLRSWGRHRPTPGGSHGAWSCARYAGANGYAAVTGRRPYLYRWRRVPEHVVSESLERRTLPSPNANCVTWPRPRSNRPKDSDSPIKHSLARHALPFSASHEAVPGGSHRPTLGERSGRRTEYPGSRVWEGTRVGPAGAKERGTRADQTPRAARTDVPPIGTGATSPKPDRQENPGSGRHGQTRYLGGTRCTDEWN